MKVGDTTRNVIGEAYELTKDKKKSGIEYDNWDDLSKYEKAAFIGLLSLRIFAVFLVIFIYICILGTLSNAFTLLSSRGLGQYIKESSIIRDPASALIIGMLTTVVLQSSTTFINVLVSMVAANMISVHMAVPMMIGSELGTSFVNGIISLTYAGDRASFKRAFSAAVLGDVFNICCVVIVLPLELLTTFIEKVSWWIVDPLISEQGKSFKTLELLTDPINRYILEVDEEGLRNATISENHYPPDHSFIMKCSFANGSRIYKCPYAHPFIHTRMSDDAVAKLVIVLSILSLGGCLFAIVWLINQIMKGRVKVRIQRLFAKDCPGRCACWTGYAIMAVGFGLTLLVQSNSVFSSSLTPLAGAGVISLDKLYALTLGSNVGTTFSGVLAAMAADASRFEKALHMAMCQVMYNVIGTLLFYPIPTLRMIPIRLAEMIGETTSRYRWFVLLYLVVLFGVVPVTVISLSLLPPIVTVISFVFIYICIGAIFVVNLLQSHYSAVLPEKLRNWEFLPVWLTSLEPYDKFITKYLTRLPFVGKFFRAPDSDYDNGSKKNFDGFYGDIKRISNQTTV